MFSIDWNIPLGLFNGGFDLMLQFIPLCLGMSKFLESGGVDGAAAADDDEEPGHDEL